MIVAYSFFPGDQDLALKNARWFNELGGCKGHDIVVCYDQRCDPVTVEAVGAEMLKAFDNVRRLIAHAAVDGWPEGANYMWRLCVSTLGGNPKYPAFMWLEPDAIPLRRGWLDAIVEAYRLGNKPFMGDRVEVTIAGKEVPLHMSGVGIYPNPLHAYAGEAYRAHEVAWDMAGKDQIVPQAHWTELIEHAWKHPMFVSAEELKTQIAPQTILFHSSKDGSLIDLMRAKLFPAALGEHLTPMRDTMGAVLPGSPIAVPCKLVPVYDIFIRTYPGDYEWLYWSIRSIDKFVTGFHKIWITSPQEPPDWMKLRLNQNLHSGTPIEWKVMQDETEDGYLAQQITKLYADVITNHEPDFILHVDSDVIFTRPTDERDFFMGEPGASKLKWYYTPYHLIQTPWQPIMEKFIGFPMPYEFMRRFPMMMPRWIYGKLREFCHRQHGRIISDYIRMQPLRAFSEFNALGSYAYFNHPDQFHWVNTTTDVMPEPFAKQFFSWGGLKPEIKAEIETILRNENMQQLPSDKRAIGVPSGTQTVGQQPMPGMQQQEGKQFQTPQWANTVETVTGDKQSGSKFPVGSKDWEAAQTQSMPSVQQGNQGSGSPSGLQQTIRSDLAMSSLSQQGTQPEIVGGADTGGNDARPMGTAHLRPTISQEAVTGSVPSQTEGSPGRIKVLPDDTWVLNGDQISEWVEQEGRLDHDQNFLPKVLPLISEGDTVIDVGAFIGDHTIAYAKAVGNMGTVHAFEPNPYAYKCLKHNTMGLGNVVFHQAALGERWGEVPLSGNNGNWGGAYIGDHLPIGLVPISKLDNYHLAPDLIKIDVEGYELRVLQGAEKTIVEHRPTMVIEVNRDAMVRHNINPEHLFDWIRHHGYDWKIMQENCVKGDPMYDILALPNQEIVEPLEASISINEHVKALSTYAQEGLEKTKYVRKLLRKHGVIPKSRPRNIVKKK